VPEVSWKKQHRCRLCPLSFRHDYLLLLHLRDAHSLRVVYTCDLCRRQFRSGHHAARHRKDEHAGATATKLFSRQFVPDDRTPPAGRPERKAASSVPERPPRTGADTSGAAVADAAPPGFPHECLTCAERFGLPDDLATHRKSSKCRMR
jgi:hypothetical protein